MKKKIKGLPEKINKKIKAINSQNKKLYNVKQSKVTHKQLRAANSEMMAWNIEMTQLADDLTNLFASVEIPIVMINTLGNVRRYNPWAGKILNLTPLDIGRSFADLSFHINFKNLKALVAKVIKTKSVREIEVKDSSGVWYRLQVRPYRTSDNKIDGAVILLMDIDVLKKGSLKLKASEEKYRNLVATSYNGIMVVRKDGMIEFANAMLEKIFGYLPGELVNHSYEILISDLDREKHKTHHAEYMNHPAQREMGKGLNLIGKKKDGSHFPIDVSLSHFTLNSEIFINCLVSDITEQKRVEDARKRLIVQEKALRNEADRNNRNKDEFLATLSHELRTPLTTILGWTQQLQSKEISQEIRDALVIIERSAKVQGQLVDDLLDVSRIHAGKISLEIHVVDLIEVVKGAVSAALILAQKKQITFESHFPNTKCNILADTSRLQQIFWNILTNAIKFTPQNGKIFIKVEITNSKKGKIANVEIKDTGMGIKSEFLTHIFERFSQIDSTMTRVYGGLGLGLAIVKSLVELHRGSIAAMSEGQGKGSTFVVTLPLAKKKLSIDSAISSHQNLPVRLDGLKVLVVDDNVDNLYLFDVMLKSLGVEVQTADSVESCMKIFPEFKPDILLSDISMPGEDGYSLIQKIRAFDIKSGGKTPAIALTAYAAPEDVRTAIAAGFSGHVSKPVDKLLLAKTIANLMKI